MTDAKDAADQAALFEIPSAPRAISRLERRLVDAVTDIATIPPGEVIPEFLHAVLCQVSLPRKETQAREFERWSGRVGILVEAGKLTDGMKFVQQPLPYGRAPRLVLIHLCTEAVRTKQREVEVGKSVKQFLETLGIQTNGGPRGGYGMFRKQMQALAACRMQLSLPTPRGVLSVDAKPITRFEAWLHNDEGQQTLWPGVMTLSQEFYDSLKDHAVPLRPEAVGTLKNSSLALDLYAWLAHRLCRVRQPAGALVPWEALRVQFGQEYGDMRDFKKKLRTALAAVHPVYRDARFEDTPAGLLLFPSASPYPKTQVMVKMPGRNELT